MTTGNRLLSKAARRRWKIKQGPPEGECAQCWSEEIGKPFKGVHTCQQKSQAKWPGTLTYDELLYFLKIPDREKGPEDYVGELIRRFNEAKAENATLRAGYDKLFEEWAALSQDDGKKDREIDRLTELYNNKKKEIRAYGGHCAGCPGRPCECGFQRVWEEAS